MSDMRSTVASAVLALIFASDRLRPPGASRPPVRASLKARARRHRTPPPSPSIPRR